MSKTKYIPITYSQFKSFMEDELKFKEIVVEGVHERIWSFVIVGTSYEIRVFSSVSNVTDVTRHNGKDAIRCILIDTTKGTKPLVSHSVYRTKNALPNVRKYCRELWKSHRSKCACGGLMVQRVSSTNHRFLGCTNYPNCKNTQNIVIPTSQTKLKFTS